jgi:D-alanyl-D-alanine carboxypeptidase
MPYAEVKSIMRRSSSTALCIAVLVGFPVAAQPSLSDSPPVLTEQDHAIIDRNPDLKALVERDPSLLRTILDAIEGEGKQGAPGAPDARNVEDGVVAISPELCNGMRRRHVLNKGAPVGCERLRLVKFGYLDFAGQMHDDGEIVVLDAIANHVSQIFASLRERGFPVARAKLMNEYEGNDDASMAQNNTSAFNVRPIAGGSSVSLHSFGVAIDLNPIQNPYVKRSATGVVISPRSGAEYVNRKSRRPGMAELVLDVFTEHGLTIWGGNWNNPTDYQHFQVSQKLASQLASLPYLESRALFERHVQSHRACAQVGGRLGLQRRSCVTVE